MIGVLISTFVILEIISITSGLLSKRCGEKKWYLCFLPIYGTKYIGKVSGIFKVFNVPVKKYALLMFELLIVIFLFSLYIMWGESNLPSKGAYYLKQIAFLPIGVSYILIYLLLFCSSKRIYFRFKVDKINIFTWFSIIPILIPIFYIIIYYRKNKPTQLSELYY